MVHTSAILENKVKHTLTDWNCLQQTSFELHSDGHKGTEMRLRGIKQKKMEIIPLSLVSVLLFVTIRAN